MRKYGLILLSLICSCLGAALKEPTLPSEDDFYQGPEGFEDAELGTILKIRETPFRIRSVYFPVNVANSWQVLVKSEDVFGNPIAVSSTILEPYEANSSRLISYQFAEDASTVDCAISYSLMGGGGIGTLVAKLETVLLQTALEEGYYVVTPDYEGPNACFLTGKLEGYAVLNSIRGALGSCNVTGLDANADVVLWGYSGGSLASSWAAGLQPDYADDLTPNLKGAALGGWVTNASSLIETVEGGIFVGLTPNSLSGLANQYPEFEQLINDSFVEGRQEDFDNRMCLFSAVLKYPFTNFFEGPNRYFKQGWDFFKENVAQEVFTENTLGVEETKDVAAPQIPLFLFHGIEDEIIPFRDAQRVYDIWCDDGIESFEFASSNSTGHLLEVITGSGAALKWIKDRFEGKEPIKGCEQTYRLNNLFYPGAFTQYYEVFSALGKNLLGTEIGPIDLETILQGLKSNNVDIELLRKRNQS